MSMIQLSTHHTLLLEYRVVFHDQADEPVLENGHVNGNTNYDAHHPYRANVAIRKELHSPASDRSCMHLEFDIFGSGISYETGFHVGVLCENLVETVEEAQRLMNLPPQTYLSIHTDNENGESISGSSLPPPFPPCTLKTALTKYADLLSPPKKLMFFIRVKLIVSDILHPLLERRNTHCI